MTDALTNYIVDRTRSSSPFILKYVPYGALVEVCLQRFSTLHGRSLTSLFLQVMPYLSRRAIENKSVLGNGTAREERIRARKAIIGRLFGWVGGWGTGGWGTVKA